MGLITGLVTWPLAPATLVLRLAELIQERAEAEYYDPVRIRRRLEDVAARAAGDISEAEAVAAEEELLDRLLRARASGE